MLAIFGEPPGEGLRVVFWIATVRFLPTNMALLGLAVTRLLLLFASA